MFEVTENASNMIKDILKKQEKQLAVRIVLNDG